MSSSPFTEIVPLVFDIIPLIIDIVVVLPRKRKNLSQTARYEPITELLTCTVMTE